MSKSFYTVSEVAAEFGVTSTAIRDWIAKGKILAVQPSGENGVYLIPATALEMIRGRTAALVAGANALIASDPPGDLYTAHIDPVLKETGLGPDELLRQMAADPDLTSRYPDFASEYSAYVGSLAYRASRPAQVTARSGSRTRREPIALTSSDPAWLRHGRSSAQPAAAAIQGRSGPLNPGYVSTPGMPPYTAPVPLAPAIGGLHGPLNPGYVSTPGMPTPRTALPLMPSVNDPAWLSGGNRPSRTEPRSRRPRRAPRQKILTTTYLPRLSSAGGRDPHQT